MHGSAGNLALKERADLGRINIAGDKGLANIPHQNEGQFAIADFFVLAHQTKKCIGIRLVAWNVIEARRKTDG